MKANRIFLILGAFVIFTLGFSCAKNGNSDDAVKNRPKFIYKENRDKKIAARMGDIIVYEKEIEDGIESELYEAKRKYFELKFRKLNALLVEKAMAKDPRKKGLSPDQFLQKYIAKDLKVTDKDIKAFIKERNIPSNHVNNNSKERIKNYIGMSKKKKAIDSWLALLSQKSGIEVYFEKPKRPFFELPAMSDSPFMGGKNAKVTVVEFSDFQCPYCAKGSKILGQIKEKYGNKVKIIFKQFPLPFHRHAKLAAEASLCAHEQGQKYFWRLHDSMFADQNSLDKAGLVAQGKKIGLNVKKFETCISSKKFAKTVDRDMAQGKKVRVKSTPTFFVNGRQVNGAYPLATFAELIDEELAK